MTLPERILRDYESEHARRTYLGEVAFGVASALVLLVVAALAKWWLP